MTANYPYGVGETFIHAELPFLAKTFDQITILPWNTAAGPVQNVPENVRIADTVRQGSRFSFYAKTLLRPRTWRLLLGETPRQISREGFSVALVVRMLSLTCLRVAMETNKEVGQAAAHPDDTIAYAYWGHPAGYAIPFLAKHGVRSCARYHRFDLFRLDECLPWREDVAESASVVVFAADDGRRYFEKDVEVSPAVKKKYRVFRLGVYDMGINPPAAADSPLVMVSCSYIVPTKRVHLIARLAKKLAKSRAVEWHHFGGGSDADLDQELASPCDGLKIHMHGTVPHSQVMEFYRTAHVDLFVHMSTSEACTVAVQEAISFNIPVVCADAGGLPEVIQTGEGGLLIPCDAAEDSAALAAQVITEMGPGGAITRSRPREVWARGFRAEKNFTAFVTMLANL